MKYIKVILVVLFAQGVVFGQSPYDSFDKKQGEKHTYRLPEMVFKMENEDTTDVIRYAELDIETLLLKCFSANDSLVAEIQLKQENVKFISRDPKFEKYFWMSPYHYCSNNPINRIDPDGREDGPVFGSEGSFRGTTTEGYTGPVIIYDGPANFTQMTEDELLNLTGGTVSSTYDGIRDYLSNNAKSKIWTHVASQLQVQKIEDETFSLNSIDEGKIHHNGRFPDANWGTSTTPMPNSGKKRIIGTDKYGKDYETTVENLQSSIVVHEWFGHVKNDNKKHSLIYEAVKNSPIYPKTTDNYKKFTEGRISFYKGIGQ